jgi:hypothetical protein
VEIAGSGRLNRVVEVQRAKSVEAVATGANRGAVVEQKGRTGMEATWKEAK